MRGKIHPIRKTGVAIVLCVSIWWVTAPIPPAMSSPSAVTNSGVIEETFVPGGANVRVEVWIDNLNIPWSLVFLPDGRALLSERSGRIRLIKDGVLQEKPYAEPGAAGRDPI